MAVSLDGRPPEFVRHIVTLPDDGAVSVFACAYQRYRCISSTARRLEILIGLIWRNSLHWRRERRCCSVFENSDASEPFRLREEDTEMTSYCTLCRLAVCP